MNGIHEISSFQALSRRARLFDLRAINKEITFLVAFNPLPPSIHS
ncbi:MAG: hypothetical protein AAE987_05950 [Thermoplasmataceae archaeon]